MGKIKNIENVEFEEVEKALKKLHIRTRTIFMHKPRKLEKIIHELSNKWIGYTEEEKEVTCRLFAPTLKKENEKEYKK